jgi:hypothetical protein
VLGWFFVRPVYIAVRIASNLAMRVASLPWLVSYTETKDTLSAILRYDHPGDIGNMNIQDHVARPGVPVAAVWFQYVLGFAVAASVHGDFRIQRKDRQRDRSSVNQRLFRVPPKEPLVRTEVRIYSATVSMNPGLIRVLVRTVNGH